MSGLKILSVAVGKPDLHDSLWIRILSIAEGLRNQGNEVQLISYVGRHAFGHFASDFSGLHCQLVPNTKVDVFHKSLRLLNEYEPDLVFANTHVPAFISAICKFKRTPLVLDMHGLVVNEIKILAEEKGFLQKYCEILPNFVMEHVAITSSDKILCVSHRMMYYLSQIRRIQQSKMEYVTNGVNLDLFKPLTENYASELRSKLGFEDKFVFGYIGGIQKWQGVEKFVETALCIKDNKLGFLIVGGDDVWTKGNVVKLKGISRKQLSHYYSACDVLVLPRPRHTVTEVAAPTKFAEYAAMGKPVLVTNVGDAAMFVKKYKCGIVIHNNDTRKLKEGFCAFKGLSEHELRRMGENSRKLATKEFDWDKILAKLDLALARLVKRY